MEKKYIGVIFGILLIVISTIIGIPIFTLSNSLVNYGEINTSLPPYHHYASNTSEIQKLNITSDVGNITINYCNPGVEYAVKVIVHIEMRGENLANKNFSYFFKISSQSIDSNFSFSLKLLSETWFDTSIILSKYVHIDIFVRKDIVIDLITTVNDGSVDLFVPYGVSINNIITNAINGRIGCNFSHCILTGNITGNVKTGKLELITNDVFYTKNSLWTLTNDFGFILIEIFQFEDMGANVTSIAEIGTGVIEIFYYDYSPYIGVVVTLMKFPALYFPNSVSDIGFKQYETLPTVPAGYRFTSNDFPAKYNYNLTLNRKTDDTMYFWNLYSEPN